MTDTREASLSITQIIGIAKHAVIHILEPTFVIGETLEMGDDTWCCKLYDPVSQHIMPIVWNVRDDVTHNTRDKRISFVKHLLTQGVIALRQQIQEGINTHGHI